MLQTLISVYGERAVRHFERDECLALNAEGKRIIDIIEPEVKVIHGHVYYQEVEEIAKRDLPKLVTFMRNPTERVISNFNWWKHTIKEDENHPVRNRQNESLKVYASLEETQNRMVKFLKGTTIDQFFFIGFLESFSEDLGRLSKLLNWPETPVFHEKNIKRENLKPKDRLSPWLKRKITKNNKEDWRLYKSAIQSFKQEADYA